MKNLLKYFIVYLFALAFMSSVVLKYESLDKKLVENDKKSNKYVLND